MHKPTLLALLATLAAPACAVVQDEIQVFDDEISARGKPGLELHLNTTPSSRVPERYPGDVRTLHAERLMAEFAYGLTDDIELGLHLPTVRETSGRWGSAGVRLRAKWLPRRPAEGQSGGFAGVNVEWASLQRRYEENHRTGELKLFGGWRGHEWLGALNLMALTSLKGPNQGERPDMSWSAKVAREFGSSVAAGLEAYVVSGPWGRPLPRAEQDQRLFAVVDIEHQGWSLNAGVGRGLTDASDRWTLKFIVGVPLKP